MKNQVTIVVTGPKKHKKEIANILKNLFSLFPEYSIAVKHTLSQKKTSS